ncbi:SO2930 family diheme c-type cytochrome [Marinobacter fonticola]|uniref:SO2930 family diheme c-type cytochrome n=1 Tax=Marinobacter fonticola TaxID=2603215 RepID=UPI00193102E4|nr:SO2930 family diheme c-type cytochrome [Marinobacter fonticola]
MFLTMSYRNVLGGLVCSLALVACGGGGSSGTDDTAEPASPGKESGVCGEQVGAVNQAALNTADCKFLSSYRLFADSGDPTAKANGTGTPYDLTTPLFTDYSSKYRFVFVPEGTQATYVSREAFDFPVGTVITKTFSIPADTAFRGPQNESMIETRLMIHRESGWVALPYIWNDDFTDAELRVAGGTVNVTTIHNGQQIDLAYQVPDKNQCKQCHQYSDGSTTGIEPIGPKARLLNRDFDYPSGAGNQLEHWQRAGILAGVPADVHSIETIPAYSDADATLLSGQSDAGLMALAKGYLDVNCAHCHRPEGGASNTGLHLEYWRDYETDPRKHGVCKKPVAYGGGSLSYDVVPGDAANSILHFRMASNQPGDKMPEIGRTIVHDEGLALIEAWIDSLDATTCSS